MRKGLLLFPFLLVFGCTTAEEAVIDDAWARPTPPDANAAAVYMTITNDTQTEIAVVGASASWCGELQAHESEMNDGVMAMTALESVTIPAGQEVRLEPGGTHLMCIDPDLPLLQGEKRDVDVEFDDGEEIPVQVVVEDR